MQEGMCSLQSCMCASMKAEDLLWSLQTELYLSFGMVVDGECIQSWFAEALYECSDSMSGNFCLKSVRSGLSLFAPAHQIPATYTTIYAIIREL